MKRLVCAFLFLAACGGGNGGHDGGATADGAPRGPDGGGARPDGGATPDAASSTGACTVTISGDVTSTFACDVLAGYDQSSDTTTIGFQPPGGTNPPGLAGFGSRSDLAGNTLTAKTYTTADWKAAFWGVYTSSGAVYITSKGQVGQSDQGTATIDLTSVSVQAMTTSTTIYAVHGTADGDLPGMTGGTVHVHITF